MPPTKVAILGAGFIADIHLESFARWLGAHATSLARCDREALFRYLGERGAKGGASGTGYKARSNARLKSR